jgi:hypothetical protein
MRWLRSLWIVSVVEWLGCLFCTVRELCPKFDLLNVPNLVVHFFRDWMCQQLWNIQSKLIKWISHPFSPHLSLRILFIIRPRRSAFHYGKVAQVSSHMCWCWILLTKMSITGLDIDHPLFFASLNRRQVWLGNQKWATLWRKLMVK